MEELIEKYLLGTLSGEEKTAFELKLKTDTHFAKEVKTFEQLKSAMEMNDLQTTIEQGWLRFRNMKMMQNGAMIFVVLTVIVGAFFAYRSYLKHKVEGEETLPTTSYQINNQRDTVVETSQGMVIYIPAGSFENVYGNLADNYTLELKEAFTAHDIMISGLETMSDSQLLETAGMFKISAFDGKNKLKITNGKELLVQVPTDEVKADMMLFDGEEKGDKVNWINPKKIAKHLITHPFTSLNFYPPGFLEKLTALGLDASNKKFTDSLYFSFDCNSYLEPSVLPSEDVMSNISTPYKITNPEPSLYQLWPDTVQTSVSDTTAFEQLKEICPASIRALQDARFASSYLATTEFEKRLQLIFKTCKEAYLNVYISNLDKDLWVSDSIVASMMSGEMKTMFQNFAKQRLGNTLNAKPGFSKLSAYHQKKRKMYDNVASKTRLEIESKYAELDKATYSNRKEKNERELQDRVENYQREYEINLKEACRQAGMDKDKITGSASKSTYIFPITNTGWKNIDRFATEVTTNRTTSSGVFNDKKVTLTYHQLAVQVENHDDYDFVYCYLIPTELNAFQRMTKTEIYYREGLNDLLRYKLVCVAEKKGESYFFKKDLANQPDNILVSLVTIMKDKLKKELNNINPKTANWSLVQDQEFQHKDFVYRKQLDQRKKDDEIKKALEDVIWPCYGERLNCNAENVTAGRALFMKKCAACHDINRRLTGPALMDVVNKYEDDLNYLISFTRNNNALRKAGDQRAIDIFKEYNGTAMNTFEGLTDQEILSIFSYVKCN